jgi:hypothetical protein
MPKPPVRRNPVCHASPRVGLAFLAVATTRISVPSGKTAVAQAHFKVMFAA